MNGEQGSRKQNLPYGITKKDTVKWSQRKNPLCSASHAILQPMRRLTAGDLAAYVDAETTNQIFVRIKITIKSTLRLRELIKLLPKIRRKRKRQAKKPPLIMEIPEKSRKLNQRRKCQKRIHQGNIILKKKHNTVLDQSEYAMELQATEI